jgi:glyoxylase-like metal-dependent hydrolase (beta-lactamase superfamily II)
MTVHTIDLKFQNENHSIAAFLIESSRGLVLIETGPASTFSSLKQGISDAGFAIENVKHVFLTHIHFDHAGAAWCLADLGAKIYVHPAGLPHLLNPEKLWNSAKQIYKDKMDELWGEMRPIAENQLVAVDEGDIVHFGDFSVKVHYTPGHAVHHNAYKIGEIVFTGDVAGVKINGGPVVPPCPAPDINIELWKKSIKKLKDINPSSLYLTHYGKQENVQILLNELEEVLDSWSSEIHTYYVKQTPPEKIVPLFMDFVHNQLKSADVSEELLTIYEYANPSWMSVSGLLRYWKLKEEGRI